MVWLILAGATAVWGGVFVAAEPLYQISSCEVVNMDAACGESVLTHYGAELVVLLAVPVLLCVVPAIPGFRRCSWMAALVVLLISLLASPATDSVFAVLIYYLPVGALALTAAAFQRWYERRQF
ncbi:hypothetical protein ABZV91_30680 [Nocardia sp. NPDC004568]|uniref:hypothetical protein n=1 Tax=Nocardia sp. NPDC004568 TaxID=3154551 RepID=UPI00339FD865